MTPEREIELLKRRERTSRAAWLRAAEAALSTLPGASRSDHPAHDLWLRVEMSKLPPVEIVQPGNAEPAAKVSESNGMPPTPPAWERSAS